MRGDSWPERVHQYPMVWGSIQWFGEAGNDKGRDILADKSDSPVPGIEQLSPVGDEVLAITAVVAPILMGVLSALKQDIVADVGDHADVKLKMLPRLYRPGDGDIRICFEYAVHEAMNNGESQVLSRIESVI